MVQQPHCPWGLQPSFTDRQANSSRNASRSEIPSPTVTSAPLSTKETCDDVPAGSGAGAPRPAWEMALRGPDARWGRGSAEGGATAAGAGGVGVRDVETGTLQPVAVVQGGSGQQLGTGRVHDDLHRAEVAHDIVGHDLGVEEHLVA